MVARQSVQVPRPIYNRLKVIAARRKWSVRVTVEEAIAALEQREKSDQKTSNQPAA